MDTFVEIFGEGDDLDALQMSCRGVVMFFIALALIRISGRRSFGVRTPLDNIIAVSLGAVMSRAIVGASAFVPVIACCFTIVLMHRLFGWIIAHNKFFSHLFEGSKIILYQDGSFIDANLKKALVCKEDVMQGVRKSALTDNMELIVKVYMERNGEISVIKK